jgi:7-cyano-7-deazaguanine synthase in queuosine biosynthesis
MKSNITVLLPFSGGLDSTVLLWENLNKGNNVHLVYIDFKNNNLQSIVEQKQKIKILDKIFEIRPEFKNQIIKESYNSVDIDFNNRNFYSGTAIFHIIFSCLNINQHYDEIQIGVVAKDYMMSMIKEMEELYSIIKKFTHKDEYPELTFPLIKETKRHLAYGIPNDIFQLTFSCEYPTINEEQELIKDCGECDKCKRNHYEEIFLKYHRNQQTKESKKLQTKEPFYPPIEIEDDCSILAKETFQKLRNKGKKLTKSLICKRKKF